MGVLERLGEHHTIFKQNIINNTHRMDLYSLYVAVFRIFPFVVYLGLLIDTWQQISDCWPNIYMAFVNLVAIFAGIENFTIVLKIIEGKCRYIPAAFFLIQLIYGFIQGQAADCPPQSQVSLLAIQFQTATEVLYWSIFEINLWVDVFILLLFLIGDMIECWILYRSNQFRVQQAQIRYVDDLRRSQIAQMQIEQAQQLEVIEAFIQGRQLPQQPQLINCKFSSLSDQNVIRTAECAICLCEFEGDQEISILECHHMFHNNCITEWLKEKTQCPLCRTVHQQYFSFNHHYDP